MIRFSYHESVAVYYSIKGNSVVISQFSWSISATILQSRHHQALPNPTPKGFDSHVDYVFKFFIVCRRLIIFSDVPWIAVPSPEKNKGKQVPCFSRRWYTSQVMDAYFGPDGNEYTVGRIPMGSCDFSVKQYSFDDVPGDYNLSHFDTGVEEDAEQRVREGGDG